MAAVCLAATLFAQAPGAQTPPAQPPAPPSTAQSNAPAARNPEAGGLLIRQYGPELYQGGSQNWALLQDARGVIYVGSTNSILEYDGVSWRKILLPSRTTTRSHRGAWN
jgi:hypothetical protein